MCANRSVATACASASHSSTRTTATTANSPSSPLPPPSGCVRCAAKRATSRAASVPPVERWIPSRLGSQLARELRYDGPVSDEWDGDTTATGLSDSSPGLRPARDSRNRAVPDSRNRAGMTVLTGTAAGQMFKLQTGTSLIGRAQNAEIRLIDDGVSRQHASIRYEGKAMWLSDLDSRNGTFVNGTRLTEAVQLKDGDKIQVGRTTVLRFAYHDALDDSFHESLLSSALRDGLTKLFNKRYLMDRLDSELKFAHRHQTSVSLLMIDIDHFKEVNDKHGHLAGDAVLVAVANVLVRASRNEDVVARFGGEEMVIILRAIEVVAATAVAERLRKLIDAERIPFAGRELHATISIGVAGYPSTPAKTPEALVEAADQALYRAKHEGRNRVSR